MTILYSLLGNKYCISELKSCPIPAPSLLHRPFDTKDYR